ncbi:COPZ [Lepeophtheirus salmonis]|uniref:Coatomer subunit zeta n=1 Tax=Lepeophtheirus salmonis TaxID=72036 RepID=A0A7R8CY31_LEPSM|nr:COPZ [Lepeophtheirus salmonis]CAF2966622.1 COPZ [Lepeophtheirus salmonis]
MIRRYASLAVGVCGGGLTLAAPAGKLYIFITTATASLPNTTTDPPSRNKKHSKRAFFSKTAKSNSEILMLDGMTILYKSSVDLLFYVMGSCHENELLLMSVLNCLYDSQSISLRSDDIPIGEQTVAQVQAKIGAKVAATTAVFQSAKDQFKWSLLK